MTEHPLVPWLLWRIPNMLFLAVLVTLVVIVLLHVFGGGAGV